ncbi:hypothetical protein LTR91_012525 [Friedmanniomyces endolithicus]|uniref:Uncharacterized protein n=1 Tax=Friedmanniomyces endolithicus TaxID=329885 RepID=A0AAN6QQI3_9PEZI|nr:hypothetical protein LTR91_012525 [Friedmanniomyces endolithicus]KAK1037692.1 hypothetical protein LTS16_012600 [Friedmanniomyces endolithicus]
MSEGRAVIEQPDIPTDAHTPLEDGQPTQQRTITQQKKQDNYLATERRAAGQESNRCSTSRRDRRKRIQKGIQDGKYMKTASLEALEEADANGELEAMGPFERIGPDSTSMDGPVTMARARRGEIPVRGSNGQQPYYMTPEPQSGSALKDQEGLKLSLEANLEIEIELKASIRGDLTISLFA